MIGVNVVGAVVVFALVRFVLPLPAVDDPGAAQRANAIAFAAYLVLAVPVGTLWVLRIMEPVRAWLRSGRPADATQQRAVLLAPAHELVVHAVLWGAGAVGFALLNLPDGRRMAAVVGLSAVLGGAATCALAYLLAQRILRPAEARALADHVPADPALPGITARVLLTWALGTGVPVLGIALAGLGELTGVLDASADRVAATAVSLGAVALVLGVAATALTARSLADPLAALRRATDRVRRGETDVAVAVDDGSEIGLLQAGFNRMVDGLRERERLRDLFGRQGRRGRRPPGAGARHHARRRGARGRRALRGPDRVDRAGPRAQARRGR
jgi:adenylate cyclase